MFLIFLFPSVCIHNFAAYVLVKEQTETELNMKPFPGINWQQIHIKCKQ